MNVPTMKMPKSEAVEAYRNYRQAVAANPESRADRAAMIGYKAMASGKALIDVAQAFRTAGLDDKGRPKVALGRASWEWCWFGVQGWRGNLNHRMRFAGVPNVPSHHKRQYVDIHASAAFPDAVPTALADRPARAMVPTIPPQLRPAGRLDGYWILWEAEWQNVPPTDPLLMRHIAGTLYVVLACWDLTELERLILGAVRQGGL